MLERVEGCVKGRVEVRVEGHVEGRVKGCVLRLNRVNKLKHIHLSV